MRGSSLVTPLSRQATLVSLAQQRNYSCDIVVTHSASPRSRLGYYMSNRYDSITPREAQKIPGFSPNSSVGASPRQGIASTHLPGSGCAPGFTCAGPANPGTISTQSSASKNHISQRWMGNGGLDFSREMVGEPAPPAVIPREPYYYQDAPLLASDVAIQEMREMGGGPTLKQAQQGWAGLAQARRQQAMSNFSVANDSSVAATAAPRDEARNQTVTIVLSQSTLEIIGIVGGLMAIILIAFAVKGLIDAVF
jgi:hypothetical protein